MYLYITNIALKYKFNTVLKPNSIDLREYKMEKIITI